ncbi:unnamed protein product, partial [Heterosigma akashiwo]
EPEHQRAARWSWPRCPRLPVGGRTTRCRRGAWTSWTPAATWAWASWWSAACSGPPPTFFRVATKDMT